MKETLKQEINALLVLLDIPQTKELFELSGEYVNLAYPLPGGETVSFLNNTKTYYGCQIEADQENLCYGVVADDGFILICSYEKNGAEPQLLLYKKRM